MYASSTVQASGDIIGYSNIFGGGTSTQALATLAVTGDGYFSGGLGVGNATTTDGLLETSGIGYFGGLIKVKGSATSTFAGGIFANDLRTNLSSCDSLDTDSQGAIICGADAGSFSGTANRLAYFDTTSSIASGNFLNIDTTNLRLSVGGDSTGSTSPWGTLSVEQTTGQGSRKPIFVVSDTGTSSPFMFINQKGNVGIGTNLPLVPLHITNTLATNISASIDSNTVAIFSRTVNSTDDAEVSILSGTVGHSVLNLGYNLSEGVGFINYDNLNDSMAIGTNAQTQITVLSTGATGVLTESPDSEFEVVSESSSGIRGILSTQYSDTSNIGAKLELHRALGTEDAPGNIISGNLISTVVSRGYVTGSFQVGSTITATAAEDWVSGSAYGTNLAFNTVKNAEIAATQRLMIHNSGYIGASTSSPWGQFSVDQIEGEGPRKPIFVVGDNGTSTPFLFVNQKGGVGIGTTTVNQGSTLSLLSGFYKGGINNAARNAATSTFFNVYGNNKVTIGTTTSSYAMVNISGTSTISGSNRRQGHVLADTLNQRFNYFVEEFWVDLTTDISASNPEITIPYQHISVDESTGTNGCTWGTREDVVNGIWRTSAGSAGPSCLTFLTGDTAANSHNIFDADSNPIFETVLQPDAVANGDGEITVGFGVSTVTFDSVPTTDGIYFSTCSAASTCGTTWHMVTCNGSCTFTTTGKTVSTAAFTKLRFEAHTGHVDFYINDIYVGRNVANVPTGGLNVNINYLATSNNLDVDYFRIWQDTSEGIIASSEEVKIINPRSILIQDSDLAEWYPAEVAAITKPGMVVSIATSSVVKLSDKTYDDRVLGVVSTAQSIELGAVGDDFVPVALQGRVPVKISLEGGPIRNGDLITSSSIPGYAMRARKPGRTIGMALESFDGITGDVVMKNLPDGSSIATGEVLMFVDLGWNHLDTQVADINSEELWSVDSVSGKIKTTFAMDLGGQSIENVKSIVSASGNWSISENGDLVVKTIRVDDITTKNLEVTQSGVTLYDSQSNAPYCLKVTNGILTTLQGSCVGDATSVPLPPIPPLPEAQASPSPAENLEPMLIPAPETMLPTSPGDDGTGEITQQPVPSPIDEPPDA